MGVRDWLRRVTGRRRPSQPMVPYLDVEAGRVVQIPASELRPGAVQACLQETNELVWVLPEDLRQGDVKHGEFDEGVRD
jgi:hypothetical protein